MSYLVDFFAIMQPVIVLVLIANITNVLLNIVVSAFRGDY